MRCSPREDGCGEGGPEPALCHLVMSTRCGAACGPKQTASQGRAPACAQTQAPPQPKAESQAPPIDSQAEPHLRAAEVASMISPALPLMTHAPWRRGEAGRKLSGGPARQSQSITPRPLKDAFGAIASPLPHHLPQDPAHNQQAASPQLGRNGDKRSL